MSSSVQVRYGSRVPLIGALVLAAFSCIGQGIVYFGQGTGADFSVGIGMIGIVSALAGSALTLAENPVAAMQASPGPNAMTRYGTSHSRVGVTAIKQVLFVVAVEVAAGLILLTIAFAGGNVDDWTEIFAPLVFGAFIGGGAALCGVVIGIMVMWPLIILFGMGWRAITGRPVNEVVLAVSLLLITIIGFAITGTIGIGSHGDDIVGTPTGRGIAQIVILLVSYSGSPTEQVVAWIARALIVALVLEVVWIRHAAKLGKAARGGGSATQ